MIIGFFIIDDECVFVVTIQLSSPVSRSAGQPVVRPPTNLAATRRIPPQPPTPHPPTTP